MALLLVLLFLGLSLLALYWVLTQPLVAVHRTSAPPLVDSARLEAHVRTLSERFYPRSFDRPDHLDRVASYIRSEFERTGGKVMDQTFPVEGSQYRNVVSRYGPDGGPLLIIGAHYDSYAGLISRSARRRPTTETHTPGADDNASGIAGLIELGRLLGRQPPPLSVELVAYCLEEPPHFGSAAMGSASHARELRKSGREVKLMLVLEMIGYFDSAAGSQRYPLGPLAWVYPDRGDYIALVGRVQEWAVTRRIKALMLGATDLPIHSINAPPIVPGLDLSDHSSYWAEGFRALMITDTAFYRNPHYHGPGDVAETLDYVRMAKVVQAVHAVTQALE